MSIRHDLSALIGLEIDALRRYQALVESGERLEIAELEHDLGQMAVKRRFLYDRWLLEPASPPGEEPVERPALPSGPSTEAPQSSAARPLRGPVARRKAAPSQMPPGAIGFLTSGHLLPTEFNRPSTPEPAYLAQPLTGRSFREVVVDVLSDFAAPAAPSLIAEYAAATYGVSLPLSRFPSLRRDEKNAWKNDGTSKPVWIAPALNATSYEPMPRFLTLSSWDLRDRMIGPHTPRVAYLKVMLAIIRRYTALSGTDSDTAEAVLKLLHKRGAAIPGALRRSDPETMEKMASMETARLEPRDLQDRAEAAAQTAGVLVDEEQRLFGIESAKNKE